MKVLLFVNHTLNLAFVSFTISCSSFHPKECCAQLHTMAARTAVPALESEQHQSTASDACTEVQPLPVVSNLCHSFINRNDF